MRSWTTTVKNGRIHLDVPTDLPEGTEVELQLAHSDEKDREGLLASLRRGLADAKSGRLTDMNDFLDELESDR
jgi:hypothetical protein